MSRLFKFVLCFLILISLITVGYISPLAAQYVFNNEYPIFYQNSATVYFSHLDTNFANNEIGTCAYVATAMLLSYYDAYWSDTFINEQYDISGSYTYNSTNQTINIGTSPGIEMEPNYQALTNTYEELVDLYNDEYFQLMLIELQAEMYPAGTNPIDTDDLYEYGLGIFDTYALMLFYLYVRGSFSSTEFQVYKMSIEDGDTVAEMREQMISNITSGTPTMYFGASSIRYDPSTNELVRDGHVMVAYDYDVQEDVIYYHTGWNNQRIQSEDETIFYDNTAIIWIDINETEFNHTCTNNYIESNTNQSFCMCKFAFHPHHTHTPTSNYLGFTSSSHSVKCGYCDDSITQNHTYRYRSISGTQHTGLCSCGYSSVFPHIVKGGNKCIVCGAIAEHGEVILGNGQTSVLFGNSLPSNDSVTKLLPNGIVSISEADYIAYINGFITLDDIYKKVGVVYD